MKILPLHSLSRSRILLFGAAALLLPALLINLGLIAFYDDEAIRALVALEMKISGNYLTPTLFGEFYYNKPPLYNWILLAIFDLTGRADEFTARLPTVFFLLAFTATIYYFFKKNASLAAPPNSPISQFPISNFPISNFQFPVSTPLALLTCGRILFWDSMLALIDICFSWVMFSLFMVVYREGVQERYGRLFGLAYLLTAIGFMLKGLPAVVFLAATLLTWFVWQKKWRLLFSKAHLLGSLAFVLPVGAYYLMYAQHNGLEIIFKTLFDESAKRTFVEYGFGQTALHLFTFPFEFLYHFLPWTLLAVYFFRKNAVRALLKNRFITWNLLVLLATILPYWSSVEVYPRYLFMHVPLLFSALFFLHEMNVRESSKLSRVVEAVFFIGCLAATAGCLVPIFWKETADVPFALPKTVFLFVAMALLTLAYWRWKAQRMLVFVLVLLVARTGFDWFVLPSRLKIECSTQVRETTLAAAEHIGHKRLFIYKKTLGLQPATGFYFTRETNKILYRRYRNYDVSALYIVHPQIDPKWFYEEITKFKVRWECGDMAIGRPRTE